MSIKDNIAEIRKDIPDRVKLVCVSKFHPASTISEAYDCGERIFGESRVQELTEKYECLPKDIQWHFIGHLQTNKIKYIVPFVSLIHGVDSQKLLLEIDSFAAKANRVVPCLLQVHIALEETKFGFSENELMNLFETMDYRQLKHVSIAGLMGMATYTTNENQIRNEFRTLRNLRDELKRTYLKEENRFNELSMGMTNDYRIAIEEGSTMVRIGTAIFGERN